MKDISSGNLSPKKRELLELLLKQKNKKSSAEPESIPRRAESSTAPVPWVQRGLWFIEQHKPGISPYNIAAAYRLSGELKMNVLERALGEIIRRHEALRTSFSLAGGEPVQVIAPPQAFVLPVADLRAIPVEARGSEALALATEEARLPFDLSRGPLMRTVLYQTDEQEFLLLIVLHHIIVDGLSMTVLFREMSVLYTAFLAGAASPLTDPPLQYGDYAAWQLELLKGAGQQDQLEFWKKQLAVRPAFLELPTDFSRPAVQTFRGSRRTRKIDADLARKLESLCKEKEVSLFMLLLAAFQALLHRYSGQSCVIVGSPITGRTRTELEGIIGLFANMLPCRADFSGEPAFTDLLQQVREFTLNAFSNADVPFQKLVEELKVERDLSRTPIFQAIFGLHKAGLEGPGFPGIVSRRVEIESFTAKFDLNMEILEENQALTCVLEYSTSLWEPGTAERMVVHYENLLRAVVSNPEERVWKLPLQTAEEREQLVARWNRNGSDYGREQTVQALFEEQVARSPEAEAVVYGEEKISYGELNRR
ncbi:MAG TPA: condensation domain-containing protein, partial [Terriglobales bacterium]|nr:condensation domain-containing protein [Terriglobales bacterium]